MQVLDTKLKGVKLVKPEIFEDFRGHYVTIYNEKEYPWKFVEHCISTSSKGVLRGLHVDPGCDKLLNAMHGVLYYVVVDVDIGQWESFILSGENHYQILKPRKYAAGFLSLTDDSIFYHANSDHYDPERQKTFRWDEPRFNIYWPIKDPILSERDKDADYIPPDSCPHGPVGGLHVGDLHGKNFYLGNPPVGHYSSTIFNYTVDGEPQSTSLRQFTPTQILEKAGIDPSWHYLVIIVGTSQHSYQSFPDVAFEIQEGMKFISISTGPTPCGDK